MSRNYQGLDEPFHGQVFGSQPAEAVESANAVEAPAATASELPMDVESRVNRIYTPRWIGYEAAVLAREKMEKILTRPSSDRITSCAIIGPSLNGKTHLLRHMQRRHNPKPPNVRGSALSKLPPIRIPIFFVQAPPEPDEDRLLDCILRALNMLGSPREPREHKIARIQSMFRALGVRMLELDEFGFFQAGSADRQRKALNGLKYLSNELQIPIVLASVEEGLNIITSNSEIANRYPPVHLPRWRGTDDATQRMLSSIETKLGLKNDSDLGTEEMATLVVVHADGILGHMCDLVQQLAEQAIRSGQEKIVAADFSPASLEKIGWTNPTVRHQRPR